MLVRLFSLLCSFLSFSYILALDLSLVDGEYPLPNSYANVAWNRSLDTEPVEFTLALRWPNGNLTAPRMVSGQAGILSFHFGGAGKYVAVASAGSDPDSQELATLDISVQSTTESTVTTQGTTSSSASETVSSKSTSLTDSTTISSERHLTVIETSTVYTTTALNVKPLAHTETSSSLTLSFPVASTNASPSISFPSSTASSTPSSATSETSSDRRSIILGSVFGCLVLMGCLAVTAFFLRRQQRRKRHQRSATFYRDMMVRSPGLSGNPLTRSFLVRGEKDSSKFESTHSPSGAVQDAPEILLTQKKSIPFQDAELLSRL